ncbi:MAG: hypothetical protein H7318_19445 [Oligoflexus sp.]|nr:hypothetical protein [Oligoflexus sp.]
MMRFMILLGILITAPSCAHSINQVYVGSMDASARFGKGKWVEVETSDRVILGFQMDTNYVDNAYAELQEKCPGRLSQVTSEHITSYLFLSYRQRLLLKGLCMQKS